jgi:nitric oxide dioxygenase
MHIKGFFMLSATARPYIDASVPVLREHGLAITSTFYYNLFQAHPELKNIFNMGNQAQGTQQQSLAAAVFAYAANIDQPEALTPVLDRIVHKHASLGIKIEHYPIVGHHLLGAIKETLGDAATVPLLEAWAEAYGLLADTLIAKEKELYSDAGIIPGHLQELQVMQINQESEHVKSFVLHPVNGNSLPPFHPGQYVSVALDFPDGSRQLRQYSLSDAPAQTHLRISVKREAGNADKPSGQVSNWLHDNIKVNDKIHVSQPFGEFNPDIISDEPIVLISAGVGITPMISTLNQIVLTQPQRPVIFAHAARSGLHHAHVADIKAAQAQMPNLQVATFYDAPHASDIMDVNTFQGEMQISQLPEWDLAKANVYLCGPVGFMKKQRKALLDIGIAKKHLHREVFGPDMLDDLA